MILPVLFVLYTVPPLMHDHPEAWGGTHAVILLYALWQLPFVIKTLRGARLTARHVLYVLLWAVMHIPSILAFFNGVIPFSALVLLGGYELAAFDTCCLYLRDPDSAQRGMRIVSLLILLSAIYGLLQPSLLQIESRVFSVFVNPLPASTVWLIGMWMPSFFRHRILLLTEKAVLILAILLTQSRSTWGGLLVAGLIFAQMHRTAFLDRVKTDSTYRHRVALCALTGTVVLAAALFFSGLGEMMLQRLSFSRTDLTYYVREDYILMVAGAFFAGAPLQLLFGNGYKSSIYYIVHSGNQVLYHIAPDNTWLSLLYDFGLLHMACLFILGFFILKRTRKKEGTPLQKASLAALGSCALPALFYDMEYWPVPMILLVYCVVFATQKGGLLEKLGRNG